MVPNLYDKIKAKAGEAFEGAKKKIDEVRSSDAYKTASNSFAGSMSRGRSATPPLYKPKKTSPSKPNTLNIGKMGNNAGAPQYQSGKGGRSI